MNIRCNLIYALLAACLILQLSFFVLAWSGWLPPDGIVQVSAKGMSGQQMRALELPQRVVGMALGLPALLALCYGMTRLARLLVNVRRGATFDRATIAHLRAFAGATLLSTLLSIVEPPLRAIVMRVGFDVPARYSVGISSEELMLVLVCALFYLITNLLHEGRRLAEENEGFV
ncbi:MAG: DUF2975 domain-containing protein [Telluria sp.]